MALTNYWWLLIWMFTGGAFFSVFFPRQSEGVLGKREIRWNIVPAVLMVVPYIMWAGFRSDYFGDTYAYRTMYNNAPGSLSQLGKFLEDTTKDKGFAALMGILKSVGIHRSIVFFLVIASIQMILFAMICRKFSCNYWQSIFLFVASTEYMSWMHNGMRQFLAVTLIFGATELLFKKKYVPVICIIIIASTLHASALLMLPFIFIVQGKAWNNKTVLCIIVAAVALVFVDQFTDILDTLVSNTQYSNMIKDWEEWNDNGTNPIRVLVYSIPMILSIIGRKQIKQENNNFVNMLANFSILTFAISVISMGTSGIFLGRLIIYPSIYSTYLLLPWEIQHIFKKEFASLVSIAMVCGYVCFFYYQMHVAWGIM